MGIIGNGRVIFRLPMIQTGALVGQTGNYIKGGLRNRFAGGFDSKFGAYPEGALAPSAFVLPLDSGAIATTPDSSGELIGVAGLTPARNLEASSSMSIVVTTAQLDQIVSLIASAMGAISVDSASLAASISMQASATGEITVDLALIGAIISTIASSSTSISGSSSTLTAQASMIAEAGGPTPLSPEGLAQAVWDAMIADFQNAGSTGEALSNAGGAGNPWDALLASNNNAGSFGERVQKILTKNQFLGLK